MRNKFAKVSNPNDFVTSSGDQYKIEYSSKVKPDGTIEIVESGKIDINEKINAARETTDMAWIIKQIMLGNMDVLGEDKGMYGDFTEFPKTYAEALQMRIDAEKSFSLLPVDVKNKFENDFNRYFATAGSEEWYQKLGLINAENNEEKGEAEE